MDNDGLEPRTLEDREQPAAVSALPEWLNPVTIRGLIILLAGILVLTVPEFSERLLGLLVQLVLILIGGSILWGVIARPERRPLEALYGAAMVAVGGSLLFFPDASSAFIAKVVGVAFALFGLLIVVRAVRLRSTNENWVFDVVRGGLYIAFAVIVATLPDTIIGGLVFAIAIAAIIVGALTLAIGMTDDEASEIGPGQLGTFAREWLAARDLGDEFRGQVIDSLFFEPPDAVRKQVGFWVLLVLSTSIATLGILADSTAVVIGAMLVAPLMTPIMAASAGIVNGWVRRVSAAFATVAGGVVVSIATAWIVTSWAPQLIPVTNNTQILSRISPTVIDMMIAVAAGAAGAYATIDKRVSSSITGVAIAVALVPPLGVVGVMLKAGEFSDAFGAFLLFATNLVSIVLVASVVFVVGGFAPIDAMRRNSAKMRTTIVTVLLGALVIVVPLAFTSEGIIVSAARQNTAQRLSAEWIEPAEGMRLNQVVVKGEEVRLTVTGQGALPDVNELEADLEEALSADLEVIVEYFPSTIVRSDT